MAEAKPVKSVRRRASSSFTELSLLDYLSHYGAQGSPGSLLAAHRQAKDIPPALEPGIGGRQMDQVELKAGDVLFAATQAPEQLGIPEAAPAIVTRPLVYDGNGQVIDVTGSETVVVSSQPVNTVVEESAAVVVSRHHVAVKAGSNDEEENWAAQLLEKQEELGKKVSEIAHLPVGTVYESGLGKIVELQNQPQWVNRVHGWGDFSIERLNLPFWVPVPEPFFRLDYLTWRRGRNPDQRRQVQSWTGHVNLGTTRQGRFFPVYCSGFFLGVCHLAEATFLVFDTASRIFRPRRPLGYVGHLKFES
ncbi:MAG: hypothetical protein JXA14_18800 [Anaerolineae bacterium]|nr:hypothetical protein [Anaerolineae bacterium]